MMVRILLSCWALFYSATNVLSQTAIDQPKDPNAHYYKLGHCGMSSVDSTVARGRLAKNYPLIFRNIGSRRGAFITDVMAGSAAEKSGIRHLDLLTLIDKKPINSSADLVLTLRDIPPGSVVKAKLLRPVSAGNSVRWISVNGEISVLSYFQNCVNACEIDRDAISQIAHVTHRESPSITSSTFAELRITQLKKESPQLSFVFNYSGDDWLFLNKATLAGNGSKIEVNLDQVLRDNNVISGKHRLWETGKKPVLASDLPLLRSMINSLDDVTIRLTGNEYYKDVLLDDGMKSRMQVVYDLYAMNMALPLIADLTPPIETEPKSDPITEKNNIRTFKDTSGKFSVEAQFIGIEQDRVRLKKIDGVEITVSTASLSAADQEWLKAEGEK